MSAISAILNLCAMMVLALSSQASLPVRIEPVHYPPGECPMIPLKVSLTEILRNISPSFTCDCSRLIDNSPQNRSCITPCCSEGQLIFDADLTSGQSFIASGSGLTWTSSLFDPSSSQTCDQQGVLGINFQETCNNTQRCKLRFDFSFAPDHTGWNFNIGDSSNNGYGGDSGHTSNAAEVHNVNQDFYVFSNVLPGYLNYTRNNLLVDSLGNVVNQNFTVTIGDEFVMFDDNDGIQRSYGSRYLFTLGGQATTYGEVDYLISLGINRVITSSSRTGTGLCRATIRRLNC